MFDTTVSPPAIITFFAPSLLISSIVWLGIVSFLTNNIGAFRYVAKGVTANPSAIANPLTITTVSEEVKFELLSFAAVSYLSLPIILLNFNSLFSFGNVTLKLISFPFALPTSEITIPLFCPLLKNKLFEINPLFKSLLPMLVLPDSCDKNEVLVFPEAYVLLTSPFLNT